MRSTFIAVASALALAGPAVLAQTGATTPGNGQMASGAPSSPNQQGTATAASQTTRDGSSTGARTPDIAPTVPGAAAARGGMPDSARASSVMSQNVETRNGEGIGKIADMIIDPQSGKVQQVIVGVGGFLGIGEKNVALQWEQLQLEYAMNRPDRNQPPAIDSDAAATTAAGSNRAAQVGEALVGTDQTAAAPGPAAAGAAPAPQTTPARRAGVSTADLRIFVDLTREQIEAAPEYRYPDEQARD